MECFVYCRDKPDTGGIRKAVLEEHWSFMDDYDDSMIARGPTLNLDRSAPTGSMHILDLPDEAAVRRFAYQEPYYKAVVFRDVIVRRWQNALGRTMWQFQGDPAMLIELPSRAAVEAMLADEPYVRAGLYADIEILDWRFGGRH